MTKATSTTSAMDKAVEISAHAAAAMGAAIAGMDSVVQPVTADDAKPLAALLAKRNAMMDAVNVRAADRAATDEEVDKANEAAFAIEHELMTTPCRTADDAVAKVAALVEFIRDAGCPDESDVENVLSDIGRILRESSYPMRATKVDRQDAHWALVPHALPAGPTDFTTRLDDLVAKAKVYSAEFVEPADKAHSAADNAKADADSDQKSALGEVVDTAWKTWEDSCSVYRSLVEPILALTPATPEQLLRQVEAYADLMAVHWARNPEADTPLGRLGEDEVDEIAEHMHASLKRMFGHEPSPDMPAPPITPTPTTDADVEAARGAIVAEAADYAALVTKAQDAFNDADDAWTKDRENRSSDLAETRSSLEDAWAARLEQHHAIAKRILSLPALTAEQLAGHVTAYAGIMAPIVGKPGYHTALESLPSENLIEIVNLLAGRAGVDFGVVQTGRLGVTAKDNYGHAVSPAIPDPGTPFGKAVALREQLRSEVQAYEDAHDADAPAELKATVTEAEYAMYRAPAVSLEEVIWKFSENVMESEGCYTHAEAIATLEDTHGLEAAAALGVYRDLELLAGVDNGAHGRADVRHRWTRARLLAAE